LEFDGYTITFAKHDEAENAREYDLDHEVWLMLLGYLLYARSTSAIAKAVFGFGMLRHVHESEVMARVVIKACMNAESQVPPSVAVCVGEGPWICTWTILVFILSTSSTTTLAHEDEFCPFHLLHPLPPQAPHWMGSTRDDPVVGESHVTGNATP
jgi:hypothetical protein